MQKKILLFESWLILEKNKAVEYFRQNPEALSKFAGSINRHKNEWSPDLNDKIKRERTQKIRNLFIEKLSILPDVNLLLNDKSSWTIGEIMAGYREGYSEWYDWKNFYNTIDESNRFDDLLIKLSKRNRMWRFPGESYNDIKDLSQYGKFYSFLKNNFYFLKKSFKWLDTALAGIKKSDQTGYEKDLMKLGLSVDDVEIAMSYVKEWTSMSRKKLDPSVWPLLQKISVDPAILPKYLYRGIFYDGAKIKDLVKWSKQWYPGSKPGVSQGKVTSWSIDRGTASSFMIDQDFIKDKENGYYMLLKWEVDPEMVIADLRNLPVDHKYWNQQEIIVSPKAKNYEIDTMIPGKEGYEGYRKFIAENPGGQGATGKTKSEMAMRFIQRPFDKLSVADRIEFKKIAKMTVGEFKIEYPKSLIDNKWNQLAMPLWNYIDRMIFTTDDVLIVNRNEVKYKLKYLLEDFNFSSRVGPDINAVYQKYKKEYNFNSYNGKDAIISNYGHIRLTNDDFYNMNIEVSWPTEFEIVKGGRTGDKSIPRKEDIESDAILKKIFDDLNGSNFFVNLSKTSAQKEALNISRNININIS
jgi:hypothetical protein